MFAAFDSGGSTSEELEDPLLTPAAPDVDLVQAIADAIGGLRDPLKYQEEPSPEPQSMTPNQLKRARRSAIEKKSRQRRQVQFGFITHDRYAGARYVAS